MKWIIALLLAFFRPGVADDPPAEDMFADGAGDDPPPEDSSSEDTPPADDEPPAKTAAQEEAERHATEQRERTERLERENVELRARLAPRTDAAEEEENRRLADANTPALEKWQIQANRE